MSSELSPPAFDDVDPPCYNAGPNGYESKAFAAPAKQFQPPSNEPCWLVSGRAGQSCCINGLYHPTGETQLGKPVYCSKATNWFLYYREGINSKSKRKVAAQWYIAAEQYFRQPGSLSGHAQIDTFDGSLESLPQISVAINSKFVIDAKTTIQQKPPDFDLASLIPQKLEIRNIPSPRSSYNGPYERHATLRHNNLPIFATTDDQPQRFMYYATNSGWRFTDKPGEIKTGHGNVRFRALEPWKQHACEFWADKKWNDAPNIGCQDVTALVLQHQQIRTTQQNPAPSSSGGCCSVM